MNRKQNASPVRKSGLNRSKPAPLALEARLMFDGAAVATALADAVPTDSLDSKPVVAPAAAKTDDSGEGTLLAKPLLVKPLRPTTTSVVFIDPAVADWQTLTAGIKPGAEVIILDPTGDALKQIADAVKPKSGLEAIHIVSHGVEGGVVLAGTVYDTDALSKHQDNMATIAASLSVSGDIILYGCDVAKGSAGAAFVDAFAVFTGADVAASTDATGNAALGGDWDLEYSTGEIGAPSIEATSYSGLLLVATVDEADSDVPLADLAPGTSNRLISVSVGGTKTDVSATGSTWVRGAYGILSVNAFGTATYNPDNTIAGLGSNQTVLEQFSFVTQVGAGDPQTDTLNITVRGVGNNTISATEGGASVSGDLTASATVTSAKLSTDSSFQSLNSSFTDIQGAYGVLSLKNDGTFSYQAQSNIAGLNAGGTRTDTFTYRVGGNNYTLQVTINGVTTAPENTAPVASADSYTVSEDSTLTISTAATGILANDTDANSDTLTAQLVSGPTKGSLTLNANGTFTYTPNANYNGADSFTYKADDGKGGLSAAATVNITVTAVNDAPSGADKTVSVNEDATYTFTTADFGFTDVDGGSLLNVIVAKPANGSLYLNGTAITAASTTVSAADIAASKLTFKPAANANGTGYANFTFQVQDNQGTANGGQNTDQSANKITIDVTEVNDAPSGADKTVSVSEDGTYTFTTADFGFTDVDGGSLSNVIVAKPASGLLYFNGTAITAASTTVSAADITAGKLTFKPAANANGTGYANFTFQVQDNQGTANGGENTDLSANTITIDVVSVNDAPSGADKTVSVSEDGTYTFTTADFGFTDVDGGSLSNVIVAKPASGSLYLNGTAITAASTTVSAADITSGKLTFKPAANANGTGYANFTFQVQDNQGTANGGQNIDQSANTITIDVASVNDAPSFTGDALLAPINEDTLNPSGATISTLLGAKFSDAADQTDQLAGIAVTADASSSSAQGDWQYKTSGSSTWRNIGSVSENSALLLKSDTMLRFVPNENYNGTPGSLTVYAVDNSSATTFTVGSTRQTFNTATDNATSRVSAAGVTLGTSINAVNDAPVADGNDYQATEDVIMVSKNVITDDNNGGWSGGKDYDIDSSTLTINSVKVGSTVKAFSSLADGAGAFAGWKVLDLSHGTAYLKSDGSMQYLTDSNDTTGDSFHYRISDGSLTSDFVTVNIDVTSVNDAPILSANPLNPTFTEDGSDAQLFNSVTVSTVESHQNINQLVLTISNVRDGANEILVIDDESVALTDSNSGNTPNPTRFAYSVELDGTTATVTISGSESASAYRTMLNGLTYRNTSQDPHAGDRVVTLISVRDTGGTSNGGDDTTSPLNIASTVTIVPVNDAPVMLYPFETTSSFTNSTDVAIRNDRDDPQSSIVVSGMSGTVSKVTVTVTLSHTYPDDMDIYLVAPNGSEVTLMSDAGGRYDVDGQTFTFDIDASDYLAGNAQLSSGTYLPTDYDTNRHGDEYRGNDGTLLTVLNGQNPNGRWTLHVGDDTRNGDFGVLSSWTLSVTTKGLSTDSGVTATYTENTDPVVLAPEIKLSDVDDTHLVGAIVTIDRPVEGDSLSFTTPEGSGITGYYDSETGTLALEGNATVAQYQAALRSVTFVSSSDNPTAYGEDTQRQMTWTVTDANSHREGVGADSGPLTTLLDVKGVNDAPTVDGALSATGVEDGDAVDVDLLSGAGDVDQKHVLSVVIDESTLPAGVSLGEDGSTLTVDPTHAAFQSLAAGQEREITVTYLVQDEQGATVDQSVTITITGMNDAPMVKDALSASVTEDGKSIDVDLLSGAFDVDQDHVLSVVIDESTLPAGVSLGEDGRTLTVDPTDASFQSLAAGQEQEITVTYLVQDEQGESVKQSVKITITGTNDLPVAVGEVGAMSEDDVSATFDVIGNDTTDVDAGAANLISVPRGISSMFGADLYYRYVFPDLSNTYHSLSVTVGDGVEITHDPVGEGSDYFTVDFDGEKITITMNPEYSGNTWSPTEFNGINISDISENLGAITGISVSQENLVDRVFFDENNIFVNWQGIPFSADAPIVLYVDIEQGAKVTVDAPEGVEISAADVEVTVGEDNKIVVTPGDAFDRLAEGEEAVIHIPYVLTGNVGDSSMAELTVTVHGKNDAPVADRDYGFAVEAGGYNNGWAGLDAEGNVLSDDTDVDTHDTKVVVGAYWINPVDANVERVISDSTPSKGPWVLQGLYGTLTLEANGHYTYVVDNSNPVVEALAGGDSKPVFEIFSYTMSDGQGAESSTELTIFISGQNDAPVANGDIPDQLVGEGSPFGLVVPDGLFSDVDNATLAYRAYILVDGPEGPEMAELPAWLIFDPETRTFSGTPATGDVGEYMVVVQASDSVRYKGESPDKAGLTASVTFKITVSPLVIAQQIDPAYVPGSQGGFDFGNYNPVNPGRTDGRIGNSGVPDPTGIGGTGQPGTTFNPEALIAANPTAAGNNDLGEGEARHFELAAVDYNGQVDGYMVFAPPGVKMDFVLPKSLVEQSNGSFVATRSNGDELPNWLRFDPVTGKFVGKAPKDMVGTINIQLTGKDAQGNPISIRVTLVVDPTLEKFREQSEANRQAAADKAVVGKVAEKSVPRGKAGLSEQLKSASKATIAQTRKV